MKRINLGVVVEGHGEVETVGIVLRRIAVEIYCGSVSFNVPLPVRRPRSKMLRRKGGALVYDDDELARAVELAAKNIGHDGAIILMLDADDDPTCVVAPELLRRMNASHAHLQHSVVLPTTEFEAWYIASVSSLAGYNGMPNNVVAPAAPETIRSAKGWLANQMGRPYSETIDQPKFASHFDLQLARSAYSFDKLCRDVDTIIQGAP